MSGFIFLGIVIVASKKLVIKTCPRMNELGKKHNFKFM
jgi:hypothetical protein